MTEISIRRVYEVFCDGPDCGMIDTPVTRAEADRVLDQHVSDHARWDAERRAEREGS